MGMSKNNMKRLDKMTKQLAESCVPAGETVDFYDLGALTSVSESAESAKKGLAKTYAVGLLYSDEAVNQ